MIIISVTASDDGVQLVIVDPSAVSSKELRNVISGDLAAPTSHGCEGVLVVKVLGTLQVLAPGGQMLLELHLPHE